MTPEKILSQHQRFKEITRLRQGNAMTRFCAGVLSRLSGWRIYLLYRFGRVSKPEPLNGQGDIVVSLTSFPDRIGNVWMVIDLLMRQKTRPADIVLCLYEGDFPEHKLPKSLDPYILRGLTIFWARTNLMPHLKYYFTFRREMQGACRCVVTVDDDLLYAPDTLSRLAAMHKQYPDAICANITKKIKGDDYSSWESVNVPGKPSLDKIALGYGAVLYPSSFYAFSRKLYDKRLINSLCLKADDLWLKYIEGGQRVKVVTGEFFAVPPEMPFSQRVTLRFGNVSNGGNNEVWKALKTANARKFEKKVKKSLQDKK